MKPYNYKSDGKKSASVAVVVTITQNASGRLGTLDKAVEKAYNDMKRVLVDASASAYTKRKAEKSLMEIRQRKSSEINAVFNEIAKATGVEIVVENASGSWLASGEYSFKVLVKGKRQSQIDKAVQAISYVAEAARQDAFIINEGRAVTSEVTTEGLLSGDYVPTISLGFGRDADEEEIALTEEAFRAESSEGLPLDLTVTKSGVTLSMPTFCLDGKGETIDERMSEYIELRDKWLGKIEQVTEIIKNNEKYRQKLGDLNIKGNGVSFEKIRFCEGEQRGNERDYSAFRQSYISERRQSQKNVEVLSEDAARRIRQYAESAFASTEGARKRARRPVVSRRGCREWAVA